MIIRFKYKVHFTLLLIAMGVAQAVPGDARITTWKNNKTAALTFTIDDGTLGPTEKFQAAFSANNVKGTFSINNHQQNWSVPWATVRQLAQSGHEIANHTAAHVAVTSANYSNEVVAFNNTLQTQSGVKPITFVYPFGTINAGVKTMLASSGFISARGVSENYEQKTPSDWFNLKTKAVATGQTVNTWNSWVDNVLSTGGWLIELWHNVDNEGQWANVSGADMARHVAYAAGKTDLWIETLAGVTKYIKQRDAASVNVTKKTTDEYAFNITDPLDNLVYNVPITVAIEVSGWSRASASQNGQLLESSVISIGGVQHVLVNAIPDAGLVTVIKNAGNSSGGTNSSSSLFSSSSSFIATTFDNFEDGDNVNNFGGYWYHFTDANNGGRSTISLSTEGNGHNSSNAASAIFTFNKGTYAYNGFVGVGVNWIAVEGSAINISTTTGITFTYRGGANRLLFQSSDVIDYDYFGYDLPATTNWTTVTIPWSSFAQGGWGVAKSSIALDKAISLAWQITDADGVSGSLFIDNVAILGTLNLPTVQLINYRNKSTNFMKNISTRLLSDGFLEVYSVLPMNNFEVRNIRGKLVYSANARGKLSHIINLKQGLYIISSTDLNARLIVTVP